MAEKLGVAQQSRGTVMVSMKEGQRLLLEDQKDGIEQFEILCEVVEL